MPLEPLRKIESRAHVMTRANIDTDIVFPARFLVTIEREGLGRFAFNDWRKTADGLENPEFPAPELMAGTHRILIGGVNFGCGSSREHAVWALADLGIRCVIAPSFGEIFYSNCFKNGVLPVPVDDEQDWKRLCQAARSDLDICVDLDACTVAAEGVAPISFSVPAFRRDALLNGWDEIDMVLAEDGDDIRAFEASRKEQCPWLFEPLAH